MHRRKVKKVVTATNMCSNFGGFCYSPSLKMMSCLGWKCLFRLCLSWQVEQYVSPISFEMEYGCLPADSRDFCTPTNYIATHFASVNTRDALLAVASHPGYACIHAYKSVVVHIKLITAGKSCDLL